jgi:TolA-binding protein
VTRTAVSVLLVSALFTACASGPFAWPPFKRASTASLEKAERLTENGQYQEAVAAYDEFLAGHPNDAQASRALANRDAIAGYLAARGELARLRHDLTAREAEVARLREELARMRQESERMRADLERLKQIDLRQDRRR